MKPVSARQWEYVADDLPPDSTVPERSIDGLAEAQALLHSYLVARARAILGEASGQPALMLSGGVDSIVTAAALVATGSKPVCVTVVGRSSDQTDLARAEKVARHFELEHEVVWLEGDRLFRLIKDAVAALEIDELWEVTAAIPFKAAFDRLAEIGHGDGPVITGGGADVLLAGGMKLDSAADTESSRQELETAIWSLLHSRFIYARQIPDFYDRILGADCSRLFQFFQTKDAWEATCRLGPEVLFVERDGIWFDKAALRWTAQELGVPEDLAWTPKEPLQVSSGVIGALETLSREMAREFPGATTYSDPIDEPASQVLARWAIRAAAYS